MEDREQNGQKFEDTKRLIRRQKSMKDREHNGQKFEAIDSVFNTFSVSRYSSPITVTCDPD
jgi:hypothetical protein